MLQSIKQKLTDKQGVSFLFAMVAFLVASMVAATIIAAAMTGVKSVKDDKETTQVQLTLTSAAELVRDSVGKTTVVRTTNPDGTFSYSTLAGSPEALQNELIEAVKVVETNTTFKSSEKGYDFSLQEEAMQQVNVTYTMQTGTEGIGSGKYQMLFVFEIDGKSEKLYLSMTGSAGAGENYTQQKYTWDLSTARITRQEIQ